MGTGTKCMVIAQDKLRRLKIPRLTLFAFALAACAGPALAQDNTVNVNGTITVNTCNLSTPDVQVDMGQVGIAVIDGVGVGSPIADFTPLSIDMVCERGANVRITLQDASNPGSTLPYIGLRPGGGVATGVGIQLARAGDGSIVPLGPSATWVAGTNLPAGNFSIAMRAHYYRTSSATSAGAANAGALFGVEYF